MTTKDPNLTPFDFQPRTRIVFGPDKIDALGELASELGARRALVVSDPGVIAAGISAASEPGVDFLLARTDPSEYPALVVLTAGGSEGCSYDESPGPDAASQCLAIRAAAQRARQAGVALWLVGPGDSWPPAESGLQSPNTLTSVARETPDGWAAATFEGSVHAAISLVQQVLSGAPVFREVRFRISFIAPGALAAGTEVRGELFIWDQGWGAWNQRPPFRATVPAPAG